MQGLMMDFPLTITSIMEHAERVHGAQEIVSVTRDNPRHRYTYADAFGRVRQLANAMKAWGMSPSDRVATLAWNDYRHLRLTTHRRARVTSATPSTRVSFLSRLFTLSITQKTNMYF